MGRSDLTGLLALRQQRERRLAVELQTAGVRLRASQAQQEQITRLLETYLNEAADAGVVHAHARRDRLRFAEQFAELATAQDQEVLALAQHWEHLLERWRDSLQAVRGLESLIERRQQAATATRQQRERRQMQELWRPRRPFDG